MADVKISALPASTTPLAGTEVLPIVQSSTTKQVSVADLTAGRAISASSLTLTTPLSVANGGTGITSFGAGVATALGNAVNGASGICVQDASGNLGLGVTPSAAYSTGSARTLQIGAGGYTNILTNSGGDTNIVNNGYLSAANTYTALITAGVSRYQLDFGTHKWYTASGTAGNAISFTQAMTLTSAGSLLLNTTTSAYATGEQLSINTTHNGIGIAIGNVNKVGIGIYNGYTATGTATALEFQDHNSNIRGSITVTTSATAFNTSSDISLKENIRDASSSLSSILAMKIRQFDWKSGGHTDYGVVAQEADEYAPEIVTKGDKWAVDYGRITPRLIRAFQELAAEVAMLKGQLNG